MKSKGTPLEIMAHLKKSIVQVKAEINCLAHALLIAKARVHNDPYYNAYRDGRSLKIRPAVQQLLATTGLNLDNGGGIPVLSKFQENFNDYKIVVYTGLYCDSIRFERQVQSSKNASTCFMMASLDYHVITNLTGTMAKRSCVSTGTRIPCDACDRHFRRPSCFENHKTFKMGSRRQKDRM
jgi:hypothetical protein